MYEKKAFMEINDYDSYLNDLIKNVKIAVFCPWFISDIHL